MQNVCREFGVPLHKHTFNIKPYAVSTSVAYSKFIFRTKNRILNTKCQIF